MASKAFVMYRT